MHNYSFFQNVWIFIRALPPFYYVILAFFIAAIVILVLSIKRLVRASADDRSARAKARAGIIVCSIVAVITLLVICFLTLIFVSVLFYM